MSKERIAVILLAAILLTAFDGYLNSFKHSWMFWIAAIILIILGLISKK